MLNKHDSKYRERKGIQLKLYKNGENLLFAVKIIQ